MSVIEFSEIQARRNELREDAGATTATKDAAARGFHGRIISVEGVVEDVIGLESELTVLLAVEGEILSCPLVRVHGRSMEETVTEVGSLRKADRVFVTGKLTWPTFDGEMRIGIATAEKRSDEG